MPTPTPLPASAFSVNVVGYQEHGAMFELRYDGDLSDLESLTIYVSAQQGSKQRDHGQVFRPIGGRYLAEMTDAMYELGPISIRLVVTSGQDHDITQTLELMTAHTQLIAWMRWIGGESGISNVISVPNPKHAEAYDLAPVSSEFPDGNGRPIYSPCRGIVVQCGAIPGTDKHNMWLFCEDVGFWVQIGHMLSHLRVGDRIAAGQVVGHLHPEAGIDWYFHTHTTARRPKVFPPNVHASVTENSTFVDMFNPHMQLGGEQPTFGFWLPEHLPQSVRDLIVRGIFVADYSTPRGLIRIP